MNNSSIYISYDIDDTDICAPYLKEIERQDIDFWSKRYALVNHANLIPEALQELRSRHVFVVLLTINTRDSLLVAQEAMQTMVLMSQNPLRKIILMQLSDAHVPQFFSNYLSHQYTYLDVRKKTPKQAIESLQQTLESFK